VSLKEIQKQIQIPGKGQNETLEIANPVEHTWPVTVTVQGHVPENGTCSSHFSEVLSKFRDVGLESFLRICQPSLLLIISRLAMEVRKQLLVRKTHNLEFFVLPLDCLVMLKSKCL
jgi:hypothetical protein